MADEGIRDEINKSVYVICGNTLGLFIFITQSLESNFSSTY